MNRNDVEQLLVAIAQERAGEALRLEAELYGTMVKERETEEHYRACFDQWSGPMQELGRKHRGEPATGEGIAFFLHSTAILAHVGLAKEVIQRRGERKVSVFCLGSNAAELQAYLGVPCYSLGHDAHKAFIALRSMLSAQRCGTLIWVSAPLYASYALASRFAERQVYWAMRFHSVDLPEIDGYVSSMCRRSVTGGVYHGQSWQCAHAPLSVYRQAQDLNQAERYRQQFGFPKIIGTVAREEKIAHPDYLEAVAQVLHRDPETLFLWTGRQERPDIRRFFDEQGLSRRNRFLGWVDPDKFMAILDVFLETFPQGGTMSWLAMAHGVPVVAMVDEQGVYGWIDSPQVSPGAARDGVEYADRTLALLADMRDGVEYADRTLALLADMGRYGAAVAAGEAIYANELRQQDSDCKRLWGLFDGH